MDTPEQVTAVRQTTRLMRPDGTGEEPVWFTRGDDVLFGVYNSPAGELSKAAIVCVHNGGYNMTAHHNQMWTRLCRQAAADGLHAFRFDLTGTGDSTGTDIRNPYGQAAEDTLAAVQWLRDRGVERVVLIGTCRGAMISLGAAPRTPGLAGVFLCAPALAKLSPDHNGLEPWQAPTVRSAIADGLSMRVMRNLVVDSGYRRFVAKRASARLKRAVAPRLRPVRQPVDASARAKVNRMYPLEWLADHRVPVTVYLGRQDPHYRQLQEVRSGVLGRLLDQCPSIEVDIVDGSIHRFINVEGQERFLSAVRQWSLSLLSVPQPA
jgi:pimeloyl-ACP methyl ester carboxylesterase